MTSKTSSRPIRVFKNPYFEALTRVHPIVPLLLWAPVVVGLLVYSYRVDRIPSPVLGAWMVLGIVAWTLMEYLLHRFLFHFPARSKATKWFVFFAHGVHHDAPNDYMRLVIPPVPALLVAMLFYSVGYWAVGPVAVNPLFAGIAVGYLWYDYTHFATHHITPRTAWGRYVKQYHMMHHFAAAESKWGVSSPLWDYVFGTVQERHGR